MNFKRFIDLSVPIENNTYSDPPPLLPKIQYIHHTESIPQMTQFFPGLTQQDLPDGEAWSLENITLTTHSGTHLDAPYHYATTMDHGKPADAWSWDAPFKWTAERFAKEKDPAIIWEGHKAGRQKGYCHLEKLHNLEQLPATGFTVCCFPVKIKSASAGWTRAVALIKN